MTPKIKGKSLKAKIQRKKGKFQMPKAKRID
jgi:hypothetical protein